MLINRHSFPSSSSGKRIREIFTHNDMFGSSQCPYPLHHGGGSMCTIVGQPISYPSRNLKRKLDEKCFTSTTPPPPLLHATKVRRLLREHSSITASYYYMGGHGGGWESPEHYAFGYPNEDVSVCSSETTLTLVSDEEIRTPHQRVRFAEERNVGITIPNRASYSKEHKRAIWYSRREIRSFVILIRDLENKVREQTGCDCVRMKRCRTCKPLLDAMELNGDS